VAQSGSAPVWGTGGRRFKSGRPDQNLPHELTLTGGPWRSAGSIIRARIEDEIVHIRRIDPWPPNGPGSARTHRVAVIARGQEGTTAAPYPAGPNSCRSASFGSSHDLRPDPEPAGPRRDRPDRHTEGRHDPGSEGRDRPPGVDRRGRDASAAPSLRPAGPSTRRPKTDSFFQACPTRATSRCGA
jgi:hypothetical protein